MPSTKARKFKLRLLVLLIASGVITPLLYASSQRYLVSIDLQDFEKCLPYSLYIGDKSKKDMIERGDIVFYISKAIPPAIKDGLRVAKIVAGMPGDNVVISNDKLFINGEFYAPLYLIDSLHKKHGDYDREFIVKDDEYFVVGSLPGSFDSRYWGPIKTNQVIARGQAIL